MNRGAIDIPEYPACCQVKDGNDLSGRIFY